MPPTGRLRQLVDCLSPEKSVGVEIGVYKAQTSVCLLRSKNLEHLYCIDPYIDSESLYAMASKRLSKYPNSTLLRMKSHAAVTEVPSDLDFVFIDGDHRYEAVLQDLHDWVPKLKSGGLLVGHDWCQKIENAGVPRAGTEYFANFGDLFELLMPNKKLRKLGLPYRIGGSGLIHKEHRQSYPLWWRIKK